MTGYAEQAAANLAALREKKPLIHNITNFVVMNFTANALLAMGASPVMAHAANEVEEMVAFAGALVLNIGTLTDEWVDSMITAGKKASERNTPIILDPVGSGVPRVGASDRLGGVEQRPRGVEEQRPDHCTGAVEAASSPRLASGSPACSLTNWARRSACHNM